MATHSSTLAWKIPWTEEPGGLQIQTQASYWGPASAGSRGTLRMNSVGKKKREKETRLGMCSRVWQIFIFIFFTIAFVF